jgi:ribose transport system substrate-binding protein
MSITKTNWPERVGRTLLTASALAILSATTLHPLSAAEGTDRFGGMSAPEMAKKPYKIAYAAVQMNEDFYLGMAWGIFDETKREGAQLVRITNAGGYGKTAAQIGQLEELRALGVDAVLIVGASFNGFDKVVERLNQAGIKVVSIASPIGAPLTTAGITQDEKALGATIANYVCTKDPKGTVLTLPGPAGTEWNKERFEGFKEKATSCGLKMVGNTFKGNISIEDGQAQAADELLKYPDVKYVYAVAGAFAVGVGQQIKRSHGTAKVVTGTIDERTIELVKQGVVELVVSEPSVLFGRAAVQYAVRSLNGDPLPNTVKGVLPYPAVFVPNKPVTADNVASYNLYDYDLPPKGWTPPSLK